jgi:mono/diheme cytochrome c family protein
MSRVMRCGGRRRAGVLWIAALWLFPVEIPLILPEISLTPRAAAQYFPQDAGGQDPGGLMPDDMDMPQPGRTRAKAARKRTRLAEKGTTKKADTKAKGKTKGDSSADAAKAADPGGLKFSQDIAPILVANCVGCHSGEGAGVRRGKLDLTTFEKLKAGTPDHKVLTAGKPEDSHLVMRINGEEEPKMPQGANRALSQEAIAKITQWVKEGARLDAGINPKVAMDTYAATPEQLRRRQLAQTPAKERDAKVTEVGQARWKQSNAKQKPEVVPGTHFVLFSNLPNDRATSTLKAMETQYGHLKQMLGSTVMEWPEKVSFYVFNGKNEFIEFVRSVEGRDVEAQELYSVRFNVPQPYVVAIDPAGGKKEEAPRRRAKGKKAEEADGGGAAERSLPGLLTEAVTSGSVAVAGNAPRWIREGLGTFMAARVEGRSPYYQHLRQTAFQNFDQGWQTKASLALGGSDQMTAEDLRAVSFALVECMMKSELSPRFPAFLHGMIEGGQGALDDVLRNVYEGTSREVFLNVIGEWIATNYGRVQ